MILTHACLGSCQQDLPDLPAEAAVLSPMLSETPAMTVSAFHSPTEVVSTVDRNGGYTRDWAAESDALLVLCTFYPALSG